MLAVTGCVHIGSERLVEVGMGLNEAPAQLSRVVVPTSHPHEREGALGSWSWSSVSVRDSRNPPHVSRW